MTEWLAVAVAAVVIVWALVTVALSIAGTIEFGRRATTTVVSLAHDSLHDHISGRSTSQGQAAALSDSIAGRVSMDDEPKSLGSAIDALRVKPVLMEGDLIADVVVIMRVIEEDGDERLSTTWSEGLSWVTRSGMLHNAQLADDANILGGPKDD